MQFSNQIRPVFHPVSHLGLPILLALLCVPALTRAALRDRPDRRAIQWSDAIVHAQLIAVANDTAAPAAQNRAIYDLKILDSVDGALTPNSAVRVLQITPPGLTADPCGPRLTPDDVNKKFLVLLLRRPRTGDDVPYLIVTIAPADTDPDAISAFNQLVADTRRDEHALTQDQAKAQAQTLADAQDDTEAEQAEDALRDMGPKAVPGIRQVLDAPGTTNQAKAQLAKLIKDLLPPTIEGVTTTEPTTSNAE